MSTSCQTPKEQAVDLAAQENDMYEFAEAITEEKDERLRKNKKDTQ